MAKPDGSSILNTNFRSNPVGGIFNLVPVP
jgi:hypothetical protein